MRYAIGVDVGGSSARAALVREDGQILATASRLTGFETPRDELLARFRDILQEVLERGREARALPVAIGIGMPGFQDEHGRVDSASNLPQLNGVDVTGELSRATGLRAAMENDMNAVALGEYHFGGHKVGGNLLAVAVGTGIGAAVVQGGRILRVARGCLGDPGHVLVEPGGRLCRCGAHGCLEAHVAGWAMIEQAHAAGIECTTPKQLFDLAQQGHIPGHPGHRVRALLDHVACMLGIGLASFAALYQPERIVLGGNVLEEGRDLLLPRAREEFCAVVQPWMRDVEFATSRIAQTAGVLGAAARVLFE